MTPDQKAALFTGLAVGLLTAFVTFVTTALTLFFGGKAAARVAGDLSRAIKISEFRVKWIEELRSEIANFVGVAHRWIRLFEEFNDLTDQGAKAKFEKEQVRPVQNEALVILYRIRMRINPRNDSPTKTEDDSFLQALLDLLNPGKFPQGEPSWISSANETVELARKILKREWEETKKPKPKL